MCDFKTDGNASLTNCIIYVLLSNKLPPKSSGLKQ